MPTTVNIADMLWPTWRVPTDSVNSFYQYIDSTPFQAKFMENIIALWATECDSADEPTETIDN